MHNSGNKKKKGCGKKKTKATRRKKPPPPRDDPWKKCRSVYGGRLSPAEEFSKVRKLNEPLKICKEDVLENQKVKAKKVTLSGLENYCKGYDGANSTGLCVSFADCGIEDIVIDQTSELWAHCVLLNLSGNKLKSFNVNCFNFYVRSLNLGRNNITAFVHEEVYEKLLILDISHNEIEDMESILKSTPNLRVLVCESCGLESTSIESLKRLEHLEELNMKANKIGQLEAITNSLEHVKKKIKLFSFEGNPISALETQSLVDWLRKECPCFTGNKFNMCETNINDIVSHGVDNNVLVQDSASCSCTEGNPGEANRDTHIFVAIPSLFI